MTTMAYVCRGQTRPAAFSFENDYLHNDIFFYIFVTPLYMKRYKVRHVLKLLTADGWEVVRTKGDHRQLKNRKGKPGTVTVNGKPGDNLSQELLNSIWKQAGWKETL